MKRTKTVLAVAALLLPLHALAEPEETDEKILNLRVEVRVDWNGDWLAGNTVRDNTGFKGKYLNLRLDGNITKNLSYSWRQRFNKPPKDASFFDTTDWIYLNYDLDRWSFSGGKQVVAIGGWEYDRAPIDLYGCSVFWNNIPCYEIGVSTAYKITPNDQLMFQVCQSPFFLSTDRNMYSYNVLWTGKHGCFSSLYSANMVEYAPGWFINYLALGNRFTFGKVALEFDVMNRATSDQTFLFEDMSVMSELQYSPRDKWKLFLKYTYDANTTGTSADATVMNGTELNMCGLGAEFMPFVNARHVLRFHAFCFYSWGKNANTADLMQNKSLSVGAGVTWYMNLLSLKRK